MFCSEYGAFFCVCWLICVGCNVPPAAPWWIWCGSISWPGAFNKALSSWHFGHNLNMLLSHYFIQLRAQSIASPQPVHVLSSWNKQQLNFFIDYNLELIFTTNWITTGPYDGTLVWKDAEQGSSARLWWMWITFKKLTHRGCSKIVC